MTRRQKKKAAKGNAYGPGQKCIGRGHWGFGFFVLCIVFFLTLWSHCCRPVGIGKAIEITGDVIDLSLNVGKLGFDRRRIIIPQAITQHLRQVQNLS